MQTATFRFLVNMTAGFGCLASAATWAQGADATGTNSGAMLEEVIVTATKRAESLQTVPLSVSVVSQEALQARNLVDTSDLPAMVPGLQYNPASTAGNNTFSIRGVATSAAGYGLEQSVGVSFDGVPLARPVGAIADLVDIQRVEALKGPQGMLFGKNASAGLINIVSNLPALGKYETNLRASFGTLNSQQYTGTTNLPVTENSALRISAWKFQHDGPIHEANTGQDMNDKNTEGARLKYRWKPNDALDLNLTGEWTSHDSNGTAYSIRAFAPNNYTAGNAGAQIEAWELAQGTVAGPNNRTARGLNLPYYDIGHTSAYTGQGDYSLDVGTLTAIVSYRKVVNDNPFDPYPTDNPVNQQTLNRDAVNYDQTTEEFRYTSPKEWRLHFVAGLFNFRLKLHEDFGIGFNLPFVVNDNFAIDLKNDNYAGFGEATFDLTSKLHLIAGVRESRDKVSESMNRTFLTPAPPASPLTNPGGSFSLLQAAVSTTYTDTSWRAGLQYEFTPDVMVYGTASRGYKGPGVAYGVSTRASLLAVTDNGIVKPEIVHAFEVGLRSQWFDRRLTLNMAVFDQTFDNFQTSVRAPGAGLVFITQNAKQLKSSGVDLDVNWLVTKGFNLMASVNYNHARYTDFKNASCYSGQTVAQGCDAVSGTQDRSGQQLQNAPKTTASLTARYEHAVSSALTGNVQVNDTYRSSVGFNNGDPNAIQKAYNVVNLSTGIDTADGRFGVSVYGNNVFNVHHVDAITSNASGALYLNNISYNDLQTFGVAFTAHF